MAKKKKEQKKYWVFVWYGEETVLIARGVDRKEAESEMKSWMKDHNCDEFDEDSFMVFDEPPLSPDFLNINIIYENTRYDAGIKE